MNHYLPHSYDSSSSPSHLPTSRSFCFLLLCVVRRQPVEHPTSQPSRQPFSRPSSQPSAQPSRQPSEQPTRQPTAQPSRVHVNHHHNHRDSQHNVPPNQPPSRVFSRQILLVHSSLSQPTHRYNEAYLLINESITMYHRHDLLLTLFQPHFT